METSKYKGVCWVKSRGKWKAQIDINGKNKHLGYFIDELEAAEAYKQALKNLQNRRHICVVCKIEKPFKSFKKSKGMTLGITNRCKACDSIYAMRLKTRKNTYEEGTSEHMMFEYFSRMDVFLNEEQVKEVVSVLLIASNNGTYFKELDRLQNKFAAYKSNYSFDFATDLRNDRKMNQEFKITDKTGGISGTRKVMQFTMEGEYIKTFNSIADASEAMCGHRQKSVGAISHAANGNIRHSNGFIWEFLDEYDDESFWK